MAGNNIKTTDTTSSVSSAFKPDFSKPNPYEGASEEYLDKIKGTDAYKSAVDAGYIDDTSETPSVKTVPGVPSVSTSNETMAEREARLAEAAQVEEKMKQGTIVIPDYVLDTVDPSTHKTLRQMIAESTIDVKSKLASIKTAEQLNAELADLKAKAAEPDKWKVDSEKLKEFEQAVSDYTKNLPGTTSPYATHDAQGNVSIDVSGALKTGVAPSTLEAWGVSKDLITNTQEVLAVEKALRPYKGNLIDAALDNKLDLIRRAEAVGMLTPEQVLNIQAAAADIITTQKAQDKIKSYIDPNTRELDLSRALADSVPAADLRAAGYDISDEHYQYLKYGSGLEPTVAEAVPMSFWEESDRAIQAEELAKAEQQLMNESPDDIARYMQGSGVASWGQAAMTRAGLSPKEVFESLNEDNRKQIVSYYASREGNVPTFEEQIAASPIPQIESMVFLPLGKTMAMEEVKPWDWAIGGAQLVLLGSPGVGSVLGSTAVKSAEALATGIFMADTAVHWNNLSVGDRALQTSLNIALMAAMAISPIKTYIKGGRVAESIDRAVTMGTKDTAAMLQKLTPGLVQPYQNLVKATGRYAQQLRKYKQANLELRMAERTQFLAREAGITDRVMLESIERDVVRARDKLANIERQFSRADDAYNAAAHEYTNAVSNYGKLAVSDAPQIARRAENYLIRAEKDLVVPTKEVEGARTLFEDPIVAEQFKNLPKDLKVSVGRLVSDLVEPTRSVELIEEDLRVAYEELQDAIAEMQGPKESTSLAKSTQITKNWTDKLNRYDELKRELLVAQANGLDQLHYQLVELKEQVPIVERALYDARLTGNAEVEALYAEALEQLKTRIRMLPRYINNSLAQMEVLWANSESVISGISASDLYEKMWRASQMPFGEPISSVFVTEVAPEVKVIDSQKGWLTGSGESPLALPEGRTPKLPEGEGPKIETEASLEKSVAEIVDVNQQHIDLINDMLKSTKSTKNVDRLKAELERIKKEGIKIATKTRERTDFSPFRVVTPEEASRNVPIPFKETTKSVTPTKPSVKETRIAKPSEPAPKEETIKGPEPIRENTPTPRKSSDTSYRTPPAEVYKYRPLEDISSEYNLNHDDLVSIVSKSIPSVREEILFNIEYNREMAPNDKTRFIDDVNAAVGNSLKLTPSDETRNITGLSSEEALENMPELEVKPETATEVVTKTDTGVATKVDTDKTTKPPKLLLGSEEPDLPEDKKGRKILPPGAITWLQGWDWKWIPAPWKAPKPYSLGSTPPSGAKNTTMKTPRETIQIIGVARNVPERVDIDLGVVDIIVTKGRAISFKGGGLYTDVGKGVLGPTSGMSIRSSISTLPSKGSSKKTSKRVRNKANPAITTVKGM